MHLRRWFPLLLILACVAIVGPAQAQQARNNVLNIDSSRPGQQQDLLEPDEVERLERIQKETTLYLPFSPPSPDDQTIFIVSEEQVGFMNLSDGTVRPIDPEAFGSLTPLPWWASRASSGLTGSTWGRWRLMSAPTRLKKPLSSCASTGIR